MGHCTLYGLQGFTFMVPKALVGSATVQSTRPRVAIEGYAGAQFLGGVALDVLVPRAARFEGKLSAYLPLLLKSFSSGW